MGLKSKRGLAAGAAREKARRAAEEQVEREGRAEGPRLLGGMMFSKKRRQAYPSLVSICRRLLAVDWWTTRTRVTGSTKNTVKCKSGSTRRGAKGGNEETHPVHYLETTIRNFHREFIDTYDLVHPNILIVHWSPKADSPSPSAKEIRSLLCKYGTVVRIQTNKAHAKIFFEYGAKTHLVGQGVVGATGDEGVQRGVIVGMTGKSSYLVCFDDLTTAEFNLTNISILRRTAILAETEPIAAREIACKANALKGSWGKAAVGEWDRIVQKEQQTREAGQEAVQEEAAAQTPTQRAGEEGPMGMEVSGLTWLPLSSLFCFVRLCALYVWAS